MKKTVNHIKWGVILTYLSLFLNIVISILYTPVMLNVLGQNQHGLYSTISSTMSWLSLLSLGFGSSYIRYYSRYKAKQREEMIASLNGMFLLIFSVIGVIALVCGFIISQNLNVIFCNGLTEEEYSIAKTLSLIVTVDMAIGFPASVFGSIIRANEKFIQAKLINLFQCITTPFLTLPILYMGYGSIGMVTVTTIVDATAYLMNIYYCLKKLHINIRFSNFEKGIFRDIIAFSTFIAINSIINQVNTSLDKILLARYVSTASVSIYTIGFSLYSYYSSFSSAVSSMFVTRVYRIVNTSVDNKDMRLNLTNQFIKLGRIQFYIQMLLCTGIILFGRNFVLLWAGQGYENSYIIAVLLCISYTIPLCQSIGIEIQRAQNKHQVRTMVYIVMTVINIVMSVILCQIYGEIGAAFGTAVSTIIIDVFFINIYYHKKLNIDIIRFWKNMARISVGLIPAIVLGIIILKFISTNTWKGLIIGIIIYTIGYCISMWLISFNYEERDMILGPLQSKLKGRG